MWQEEDMPDLSHSYLPQNFVAFKSFISFNQIISLSSSFIFHILQQLYHRSNVNRPEDKEFILCLCTPFAYKKIINAELMHCNLV